MKFEIGASPIWNVIAEQYGLPLVAGALAYLTNKRAIESVFSDKNFLDQVNRMLSQFDLPPIEKVEDIDKLPDEYREIKQAVKDYYMNLQRIRNEPIFKRGLLFQSGVLGALAPESMFKQVAKKTKKEQALKSLAPKLGIEADLLTMLNEDPNLALLVLLQKLNEGKK